MENKKYLFICLILVLLIDSCTVLNNTTSIEREYLNKITNYQGRIIIKSQYLTLIKQKGVGFINQYSNTKLQIISDTLISTQAIDSKHEYTNNDKIKIGYKILIIPLINEEYKIKAVCYTTNTFKSKKQMEKYSKMLYQNECILLCYLATNEIMPKFINNTKKYKFSFRAEDGYLDL